jgi:hypothetical protein
MASPNLKVVRESRIDRRPAPSDSGLPEGKKVFRRGDAYDLSANCRPTAWT